MCGLSTRKTVTPRSTQCRTTSQQRLPQPAPVLAVPVDVVDVLVLLGRVLGVLQRAVGAAVEPLGVLGEPRVVGRGTGSRSRGDLDAVLARVGTSASKSSSVPRSGWIASWPPVSSPIAHGLPGSSGPATSVLLRPLRFVCADRVDRRQVEDVEAELGEPRELLGCTPRKPPQERGNSSYQAPKRPRSRSTSSSSGAVELLVPRDRSPRRGARRAPRARRRAPRARRRPARARRRPRLERGAGRRRWRARPPRAGARALGQLAGEVGLAGLELARDLVAPGGERVDPRLDRPLPAPGRPVDREAARPADAVVVGVDRRQRRLVPARRRSGRLPAHDGAQDLVAVAEDVGRDVDDVADRALDRPAAAVDDRGRVLDPDARQALASAARAGTSAGSLPVLQVPQRALRMNASAIQRRPAAPDLAARRPARPRRLSLRRLAARPRGRRGGRCCRSGPPDRHGSPYKARSAFAAWRGLLADPGAPVGADEVDAFRAEHAAWIERLGGARRRPTRGRRPGALRARVGGAARVRRRPRRAPDRRRADLRRARERRPPRPPRAVPRRRGRRRAARRLHRQGPAVGQPALRLAGAARAGATAGGSSACARTFELFDLARIDHFRGFVAYWAVPARRAGRARRALAARAGRAVVRRGAGRARRAAAHRRGPRRHHAGRSAAARRARLPGHGRPAVRLRPRRPARPAPARATTASTRSLYTGTHDNDTLRGWWDAARRRPAA